MLASRGKVAIPIAMSVPGQMPLAETKNRLSEMVDRLEREHGHVIITKYRRPAAVVISVEDLQSPEETLDIMNSAAPGQSLLVPRSWRTAGPISLAGDTDRAGIGLPTGAAFSTSG